MKWKKISDILGKMNRWMPFSSLTIMAWNGIIFNAILYWNNEGYKTPVKEYAIKMTEITQGLYKEEVANSLS